jgi:hypothetical protein
METTMNRERWCEAVRRAAAASEVCAGYADKSFAGTLLVTVVVVLFQVAGVADARAQDAAASEAPRTEPASSAASSADHPTEPRAQEPEGEPSVETSEATPLGDELVPNTPPGAHGALALAADRGAERLRLTVYGFVEADYIVDSTRSYGDAIGATLVARSDVYAGRTGRSQFSMRNTRLGLAFESPSLGSLQPSAVIEGDFFGHQDVASSEATFFDSPTFRIRHAFVKLQSPHLDVIMGQTYDLFGWQNYYFPCSAEFLGLPNQLFSRHAQLRLARAFNREGAVTVEVALAAVRPAQRDSQIPDANGGIRLMVNRWKGVTTPGNVGTTTLPLSVGVSGVVRQFKVNAFAPPPAQSSNSVMGWGVSVDALIPIIPAASDGKRGHALTLTGSFVKGTGIADLITSGGGARFPLLSNSAQDNPPMVYSADIDDGLVTFDHRTGLLYSIDWQAFRVGLQYYLPPNGNVIVAANYTQSHSDNMARLYPQGGAEIELLGNVADTSRYADVSLFWDVTPAVRLGLSGQYTQVEYLDRDKPHNIRAMAQSLYVF